MAKPIVNNQIVYQNLLGRVLEHEVFLNQSVLIQSSPTFANINISNDAVINGNLYVYGNTSIFDSNITEFEDNILLINRSETGNGVLLNQSGIEINRGVGENYRFVFNESDDSFKVGFLSNLQTVSTREDNPLLNGIMVWDDSTKLIKSKNNFDIDLTLNSTTESINASTGTLIINGGVGVKKNISIDNKINLLSSQIYTTNGNLNIESTNDIKITPTGSIIIPLNKKIAFQNTDQSISVNNTNDFILKSTGDINFNLDAGKKINIPNQIPITFSTTSEKIYTDSSNNMNIDGSQNINLNPGVNKKINIPVDIGVVFGNNNQQISSNLNNDLSILSGNNIFLTPGSTLDVRIPTDSGIKFGGGGNQRIYSDSNDDLYILSSNNIYISALSSINITSGIPVAFGNYVMKGFSNGNTYISSSNIQYNSNTKIIMNNTEISENSSTGSFIIKGGVYAEKNIRTNNLYIGNKIVSEESNTSSSLIISNINNTCGDLIRFKTGLNVDKYDIGNIDRKFNINIPNYNDYSNSGLIPKFSITTDNYTTELLNISSEKEMYINANVIITNTNNSLNYTSGSLVLQGGLGVNMDTYFNGTVYINTTQSNILQINGIVTLNTTDLTIDTSLNITKTSGNLLSINNNFIVSSSEILTNNTVVINNTQESNDISTGALIVKGGANIYKNMRINGSVSIAGGLDMLNSNISNIALPVNPGDIATKAYVDLVKQGLYVKDSVDYATTTSGTLSSDFINGSIIDNNTLSTGDRILIKNQIDPIENGIYIVQTGGSPIRSNDLYTGSDALGSYTFVKKGDVNASFGFICISDPGIVGTNTLTFTEFTGLGQVDAGAGLSKNFNQLNVNVDDFSIEIVSDNLRIKNTIAGQGLTGGGSSNLQTSPDQSHVVKLGNVNTGSWNASTIQTVYGGTGRTWFTSGHLIFGNGNGSLLTNSKLFFNTSTNKFGIGTNNPLDNLDIQNLNNVGITLNSDSDGVDSTAKPIIHFAYTGITRATLSVSRNYDDYALGVYPSSLILNNKNGGIQFVTNDTLHMSVLNNGNIGIKTSNPSSALDINGDVSIRKNIYFYSTENSINSSSGAIVVNGGIGVIKDMNIDGQVFLNSTINSSNVSNGGALTIRGGASIEKDLYIGGSIFANSTGLENLVISSTTPSVNSTSGAILVYGGVSIDCSVNSSSITSGGGLTVRGGASIKNDMFIGGKIQLYDYIVMNNTNGNKFNIVLNNDDFNIDRYDGVSYIDTPISINNSNGNININNLLNTDSIHVVNTVNSSGLTTGSVIIDGGISVSKDLHIGGNIVVHSTSGSSILAEGMVVLNNDVTVGSSLIVNEALYYNNNAGLVSLVNTSGSTQWYYIGGITDYVDISIFGKNSSIRFLGTSNGNFNHSIIGDANTSYINIFNTVGNRYGYINVGSNSVINIVANIYNDLSIGYEGTGVLPNGNISGFDNWDLEYTSNTLSNLNYEIGSCNIREILRVSDNLPIINNENKTSSKYGLVFSRTQFDNDSGSGYVVNDSEFIQDTLPSQTGVNNISVRLSSSASSSNDYYNGWWIKVSSGTNTGQIRKIIDYDGSTKIAILSSNWTDQNPIASDVLNLYYKSDVIEYYDETDSCLSFGYSTNNSINKYTDIKTNKLIVYSSDVSSNLSSGSIITEGGLTIKNTQNATSSTYGGAAIINGGMSVSKTIFVGEKIAVGNYFIPQESIDINNIKSTIKLNNESYIDFANNDYRYGLYNDGTLFSLTLTTSGSTPDTASRIFNFNSVGNIAINTNVFNSQITLKENSFISSENNDGYISLGISPSESRIEFYGSDSVSSGNTNINYTNMLNILNNNTTVFTVNSIGNLLYTTTNRSLNSSSGSFVVNGGVSINCSVNSSSVTAGGGLTIRGGASINKDVYIGGDIYVNGNINSTGGIEYPILNISNTENCSISYTNSKLIKISNEAIYSVAFEITPITENINTQFDFDIPNKITNLVNRSDIVITTTAYSDDTNLDNVFNVLGVGVTSSTRAMIKFYSNSTSMHYINIICRYDMS